MLKRLITAIAYIRTMMGGATPTPPAGPVLQEPTTPPGKVSTASATKAPAKPKPKRKPSAAQSTKPAASPKPKQKPALMPFYECQLFCTRWECQAKRQCQANGWPELYVNIGGFPVRMEGQPSKLMQKVQGTVSMLLEKLVFGCFHIKLW